MESINNSNNINTELALQQKKKQFKKIKSVLKKALKCINSKISAKKFHFEEIVSSEVDENNFNEKLERSMEDQQNSINEQQEASSYCFVENKHGKFYWSSNVNRFAAAVDRDLIDSKFCASTFQQPQVQCC